MSTIDLKKAILSNLLDIDDLKVLKVIDHFVKTCKSDENVVESLTEEQIDELKEAIANIDMDEHYTTHDELQKKYESWWAK